MTSKTRIVIVGATSAIAEHCARLWLKAAPAEVTLIGRDAARLERVANDLRVRSPASEIRTLIAGFTAPADISAAIVGIAAQGAIDIALIAQGSLPSQAACQADLAENLAALEINALSPVLYAEAIVTHMERAGRGKLGIIGSVAGDRGRRSIYVYGAAKSLVASYAQGLQHRFAGSAVTVTLLKPGPTDTPMTAQLKAKGARLTPVEDVAALAVRAVDSGKAVAYLPGKWCLIMLVIRNLPAFVFNKLNI